MIKIYIASPYTKGDPAINVKTQMDCANELINLGYAPFAPLMSHFQHIAHPHPYEKWMELTSEWLECCDCLLRLPGESNGADREVSQAVNDKQLVFYDIKELDRYYKNV